MQEPEAYRGREQTYLKHFFLERYLQKVAFKIGWSNPGFVYVDGFSGPWRSKDEEFEDTSFMVAIRRLRKVRDALSEHGRAPRIRCIFVESHPKAFADLQKAVETVRDIEIRALYGEFERVLPVVTSEIGTSFALTFIDPTGWTGFSLETIAPLLSKRGEVLVNFMFDFVNRFRADEREAIAKTFDKLFGGSGWEAVVDAGEEPMLRLYEERLKKRCGFAFATHTRILKPLSDRTYFYLVYATRHPDGLIEFRAAEKGLLREQEHVRADAKQSARIEKTGQDELFRDADAAGQALEQQVAVNRARSGDLLMDLLGDGEMWRFEDVLPRMLEIPMVDASVAKRVMVDLREKAKLTIDGLKPRKRLPHEGCRLRALP